MRTNVSGVYAVGDVNGKLQLAHVAFDQGVVAAETIAGHETTPIDNYTNMPRCTYCQPQIASIGLTEAQAKEQGINVKIRQSSIPGSWKISSNRRAIRFRKGNHR